MWTVVLLSCFSSINLPPKLIGQTTVKGNFWRLCLMTKKIWLYTSINCVHIVQLFMKVKREPISGSNSIKGTDHNGQRKIHLNPNCLCLLILPELNYNLAKLWI